MNSVSRFLQKQKDPEKYKSDRFLRKAGAIRFPGLPADEKAEIHFKHSGNCGDIIYAIPAMLAIAKGRPVHLHLNINQPGNYGRNKHPLGNVMLNEKMAEMLRPLLLSQAGVKTCDTWSGQEIDVDLDYIRKYPFMLNRGNIARWYFLVFGVFFDLSQPWLDVSHGTGLEKTIIVARSQRYHAPGIRYDFLNAYDDVRFVGIEAEYEDIRKQVSNIRYCPVNNFLELARIIAGSGLFIGNQSFPFSIAEAIKANRLLEWYFQTPNVNVQGPGGFDFCFQENFERLVRERYNK
ncbi:hypothetical protein [Sediminibacterium soli]|uniref:hypothetical protein n=1 Tax=Sediminibacterium soli TaxID=2698829 RepID=UPI00137A0A2E|nr:hypothetical protein [Sediminibacterium soli]NCI45449.1 hypothetical protein [Sediminibacterium soli]